jgi:hypothetical protein
VQLLGSSLESCYDVDELLAASDDCGIIFVVGWPMSRKLEMPIDKLELNENVNFVNVFLVSQGLGLLNDLLFQVCEIELDGGELSRFAYRLPLLWLSHRKLGCDVPLFLG